MLPRLTTALLLALGAACAHAANWDGKPAPKLRATTLDGKEFKLEAERGQVVLINLWASWCEPCRQEMPAIDAYYRVHRDEGLRVMAISMDDPEDEDKARMIMRAYGFPAALKSQADYAAFGRVWRMPMTFVIDREGIVRRDGSVGEPKVDAAILERIVTPLLRSQRESRTDR